MRPPSHVPFAVPYPISIRRDSISTASTMSDTSSDIHSQGSREMSAYKDDPEADSHSYPPRQKERSILNGKKAGDLDDEDAEVLDEEERVGLMMQDRSAGRRHAKPLADEKASHNLLARAFRSRFRHTFLVAGAIVAILLFVPFLSWLSSSTHTRRRESVLKSEKHLTEVIMPPYWRLPDGQRVTSGSAGSRKHKRPLPPGTTKLAEFGGPFVLEASIEAVTSTLPAAELKTPSMDDVLGSTFSPRSNSLSWSAEDKDEGVFTFVDEQTGDITIQDITHLRQEKHGVGEVDKNGGKLTYVKATDVKDSSGRHIPFTRYKISPDMRYVLLFSDTRSQWRYSSHSKVWLHNVAAKTTEQVGRNKTDANVATAEWSQRNYVSFVEHNNLFLIKDLNKPADVVNVTSDGTKDVFNAVPDWVYEEEVFAADTTHWWSPDGNRVAFLRLDESKVETYSFPIFNPTETNGKASLYPSTVDMKYPKPGTANPVASLFVYDVVTGVKSELHQPPTKASNQTAKSSIETATVDAAFKSAGESVLVTQLVWTNDRTLIMRETNRVSDAMRYIAFDCSKVKSPVGSQVGSIVGTVSRQESTAVSGGWIAVAQDARRVKVGTPGSTAYVDVVAEPNSFRHIAFFKDVYQREPIYLTSGQWEVDKIEFVFGRRVYFSAAYPRPAVRHILYVDVPLDGLPVKTIDKPASLTNTKETAWYEVSFDPKGNYYQLSYRGPSIPWVKVFSLRDLKFEVTLEDNQLLRDRVAQYQQPQRLHYNITTNDGTVVSAEEWRPHDFDSSGSVRYPVLINVYGGPNSQVVQSKWAMNDWRTYLTCTLGYIVILLDGRGTGFRGRGYRDLVTWNLGVHESLDVVQAAEQIRRLPYVAQSKVGLWGWSYGGYLTAKVLERDSGTFDLGMSVAPVSRWEFYDSIYTERYMKTPHINKAGYENSSVHINQGFEKSHYLLAQGSGDDNVHFQSSAFLLDQLTGQKIRSFWFRMFPDSSHSINTRGAYRELHEFLTRFLVYNWGAGGRRLFRYEHDKGEDLGRRAELETA